MDLQAGDIPHVLAPPPNSGWASDESFILPGTQGMGLDDPPMSFQF